MTSKEAKEKLINNLMVLRSDNYDELAYRMLCDDIIEQLETV